MKKIFVITLFLSLNYISTSYAEDIETESLPHYDIEVIIFEDAHARYIDSELWEKDTPDIGIELGDFALIGEKENHKNDTASSKVAAPDTNEGDTTERSFNSIQPEILTQQYRSLKLSSEFNVLFRSAWRQSGLSEKDAFEIDLNKLNNTHESKSENTISGNLKIVLARYLHFYSQLEYQRPVSQEGDDNIDELPVDSTETDVEEITADEDQLIERELSNTYPMTSHRRMRSKELHYIDHPLVGILVQINPAPEKPDQGDTELVDSKTKIEQAVENQAN